ncbi:uncharacterized protein LOC112572940 [Pomacea canaliculata]|uniref:uncharacterized protein LOC112572940 n=1 Tax=Pomacea canaliculata TaxID=400727 RepID=UPI000D73B362|nr:uncharacterized protein LOC112572940 [Pomacea canaliculata]
MIPIAGVFFFLSIVPDTAVTAATCPDDVLLAVRSCTPGNFSMGVFNDMRDVQLQCRSGTFEKSLACLTTLASGCQGDQEKRDLLGQYLGLQRLRDSWDRLCQRAPLLAEHFECWEGTLQASSQCIREEMINFTRRLQTAFKTSASVRYADKPLKFVQMSCSTSRGILQCFEPRLLTTCPSEVHNFIAEHLPGLSATLLWTHPILSATWTSFPKHCCHPHLCYTDVVSTLDSLLMLLFVVSFHKTNLFNSRFFLSKLQMSLKLCNLYIC